MKEKSAKAPKNNTAFWVPGVRIRERSPDGNPIRMLPSGGIKEIHRRIHERKRQEGQGKTEDGPFERFFSLLQFLVVAKSRNHVESGEHDACDGYHGRKGDDPVGNRHDFPFRPVFDGSIADGNGALRFRNPGRMASETLRNILSLFPTARGRNFRRKGNRRRNRKDGESKEENRKFSEISRKIHGTNRYVILNPVTIRMMA